MKDFVGKTIDTLDPKLELKKLDTTDDDGYIQIYFFNDKEFHNYHHYLFVARDTMEIIQVISFQCGPIKEHGINGIQHSHLHEIIKHRQDNFIEAFPSDLDTQRAHKSNEEALLWDLNRTLKRKNRNVEGTNRD